MKQDDPIGCMRAERPQICSGLHAEANEALINGDVDGYLELITHADDYTLMTPFGGAPSRGFVDTPERRAALARFFRSGTSTIEQVASYTSGDLVVLVMIERQRVAVGDLPEQDWSLRVTQVYRREATAGRSFTGTPTA